MKILIVGAGIAGLAMYRKLLNTDHIVDLVESRESVKNEGAGICLPANAIQALDKLGLKTAIVNHAYKVTQIRYETSQRKLLSKSSLLQPPFDCESFFALPKVTLNKVLMSGIESKIQFNTSVEKIISAYELAHVAFSDGSQKVYDLVIGADGINSSVRNMVFNQTDLLDLGVSNWRFCIDAKDHTEVPSYLVGKSDAFMFYPIADNKIYCYGQISDSENKYKNIDSKSALKDVFLNYHPSVINAINDAEKIIFGRLKSVKSREIYKNNVVLIGDAMHGCPPSLKQGVALALEDVIILGDLIEKEKQLFDVLNKFKARRIERISWVIDTSNKIIRLAEMGKSVSGRFIRNMIIKLTGPQNVIGWRKLLKNKVI